ncbi:MAG: hypothetical protein GXY36_00535 [Chloroflexi bacterium]|jgi:predicted RNA-binding Zn-ribbon protein involved in translation (DUF1610 family)|nr:hypothetical protein [Chloroflexota bacterium]
MMRTRRRHTPTPALIGSTYPQYEWALDDHDRPVFIAAAERGASYRCPLCGEKMIARRGEHKQHHFAHETINDCTPDAVAQAAAARWLAYHLRDSLERRRSLSITWPCPLCGESHSLDLLDGVREIVLHEAAESARPALMLANGTRSHAAITIAPADDATLAACARAKTPVIAINLDSLRTRMIDLPRLLSGATIYGGPCITQQTAAEKGIVAEVPALCALLIRAASRPPYRLFGPLENANGLTHVFTRGDYKLWLPPVLWKKAVGGMRHALAPGFEILSQEWPQDDGSTIALYYVTFKNTHAIAVRRFSPGQPVYANLGTALFRTARATAAEIARTIAEN